MSDLPLVALGGLLGSSHCVGMCGAFALSIGIGAKSVSHNLLRQVTYCSGRVFTYMFLGSVAGFAGFWFAQRSGALIHAQAVLSILAGLFLVVQGVRSLGLVPLGFFKSKHSSSTCIAGSFLGPFLRSPRGFHVFLAGMLNGLLPCGLVYGYLALASSTASLPSGFLTMASFGAGTVPIMVLTGVGGSFLSLAARRRVFQVAAVCVLFTGTMAIARGVTFWHQAGSEVPTCPACALHEFKSG